MGLRRGRRRGARGGVAPLGTSSVAPRRPAARDGGPRGTRQPQSRLRGTSIVIGLGMAVVGDVDVPTEWDLNGPVAQGRRVALPGLAILLQALRGTAARWLGIVAASSSCRAPLAAALKDDVPRRASRRALCRWPYPRRGLAGHGDREPGCARTAAQSLIARFAAVPVIAVHAGWLLPAAVLDPVRPRSAAS